jgi:hypothetical protein
LAVYSEVDVAEFDFNKLMQDPAFAYGMSLLGSRGQANPYMQAQQAALQIQQLQQAQEDRKAKMEQEKLRREFDLQKYRTPAQAAQPAQPIGLGALVEPRMTAPTAAVPETMDWMGAAADFVKAGGDLGDMASFKHYMQSDAAKSKYAPLGGGGAINTETGEMLRDPQAQADRLELQKEKFAEQQQLAQTIAGLKPDPSALQTQKDAAALERTQIQAEARATASLTRSLANQRLPAEIGRMSIAFSSVEKGLDEYVKMLENFDPRSTDQLNLTKRADIGSLSADLLMQGKEAAALGALQKQDIVLMERALTNPASGLGALYGKKGLLKQVEQVRASIKRRRESLMQQYPQATQRMSQPTQKTAPSLPGGWTYKGAK